MELIKKRTRLITILCWKGFGWSLVSIPSIASPEIKHLGIFFPALMGLIIALRFISYVGVWHLKKWGTELLLFSFFSDLMIRVAVNKISIANVVLGLISIIVFSFYYRRMSSNL